MAKCAICFVTDSHYLLPTLVAAGQARRWSAPGLAEVIVTALDLAPPLAARAEAAFSRAGTRLVQGRAVEMGDDAVMARLFLRNARLDRMIRPAVLHFMARPKPWDAAFPPWSAAHCRPYAEIRAQWPDLAASTPPMPAVRRARYSLQQRAKQLRERLLWGRGALLEVVMAAERDVVRDGS